MIFEGVLAVEAKEDGGNALVTSLDAFSPHDKWDSPEMFVRIQSWDETTEHRDLQKLVGKRLRITIEEIVE
jgi:hypothetical protein